MKFGEDTKALGFFLAQVWNYMQEYRGELGSETAKVRCVTMVLEGATAEWMVSLHSDNALPNCETTTSLWQLSIGGSRTL